MRCPANATCQQTGLQVFTPLSLATPSIAGGQRPHKGALIPFPFGIHRPSCCLALQKGQRPQLLLQQLRLDSP